VWFKRGAYNDGDSRGKDRKKEGKKGGYENRDDDDEGKDGKKNGKNVGYVDGDDDNDGEGEGGKGGKKRGDNDGDNDDKGKGEYKGGNEFGDNDNRGKKEGKKGRKCYMNLARTMMKVKGKAKEGKREDTTIMLFMMNMSIWERRRKSTFEGWFNGKTNFLEGSI